MTERILWRAAQILCALMLCLTPPATSIRAEARPISKAQTDRLSLLTVEDLLNLETTGRGATDPTGKLIVWEQMPPYRQLRDFGVGLQYSFGEAGAQILSLDLRQTNPEASPLPGLRPADSFWLLGFSPTGRFLAMQALRGGRLYLAIYDRVSQDERQFNLAVNWERSAITRPIWINDRQLAVPAVAPGTQPIFPMARKYAADTMAKDWFAASRGETPTALVVYSRVDAKFDALAGRLTIIDASSGRTTLLASGGFSNLTVSPDGHYLAAVKLGQRPPPVAGALVEGRVLQDGELNVWDLRAHSAVKFEKDLSVLPGTLEWSAANHLAFFAWPRGRQIDSGGFQIEIPQTGRLVPLLSGIVLASDAWGRPERAVWINDDLAVFGWQSTDTGLRGTFDESRSLSRSTAGWFLLRDKSLPRPLAGKAGDLDGFPLVATNDKLLLMSKGQLWLVDPNGSLRQFEEFKRDSLKLPFSSYTLQERGPISNTRALLSDKEVVLVGFLSRQPVSLKLRRPRSIADPDIIAWSLTGRAALIRVDEGARSTIWLLRAGRQPAVVGRLNARLAQKAQATWHTVRYSSPPSGDLESCYLTPPDYVPGHRYPVIVEVYPGSTAGCNHPALRATAFGPAVYSSPYHLLAAHGYVVLLASNPTAIDRTADGPLDGMPAAVDRAVDALVTNGIADPDRLGLFGASQGGFAALYVAARTNRFKAVVAANSWSDAWTHYFDARYISQIYPSEFPFTGEALRYESGPTSEFGLRAQPWDRPSEYYSLSVLKDAPMINSPILLIGSDMDVFPNSGFDMMFTALNRLRKEATLVRYRGEGHYPSSPANFRDMWGRIFDWYDQHMKR